MHEPYSLASGQSNEPSSLASKQRDENPKADTKNDLKGIVLAGGLSSRLGHDKAKIRLGDNNDIDLLHRSAELVKSVVGNATIVGRQVEGYDSIADLIPGRGPVGGIASALMAHRGYAILVVSCDLPFMDRETLERLMEYRQKAPKGTLMTAYRQKDTGHKEALVAIYEAPAGPFFLEHAEEKKLKVSLVVPEDRQHYLYYEAENSLPFFNINYPADLEVVRRMLMYINLSGASLS